MIYDARNYRKKKRESDIQIMKAMKKPILVDFELAKEDGFVEALGGRVSYEKGDAIITGVKGEKYPCRRDIFDGTYVIVKDPTDSECEITEDEEGKVMTQNNPDVVRFVKMKTGLWLRQDNDIFPPYLLFSEDLIGYLLAVTPWNNDVDYVDFHMKNKQEKKQEKKSVMTGENSYYRKYWDALNTVLGCFYVPTAKNGMLREADTYQPVDSLTYLELNERVRIIGMDETTLISVIRELIKWGLIYERSQDYYKLVEP